MLELKMKCKNKALPVFITNQAEGVCKKICV